ncbi:thermonuclease family protein [Devosia sp.]|uniref:thermonuclease family protein n=1 Tax=Devosia sp. TaxID=1871048 RepID=UPI0019F96249|nr:thermonuclease family protein [Devosia sp.]MBE0579975.1 thermonuclease family protein [Devosia sp.]
MSRFPLITLAVIAMGFGSTAGSAAPPGYFDLSPGVTLTTGESWSDGAENFRLYGIQSCIRSTTYTNGAGQVADCGEASLAMFAAYIKDTKPVCAPVIVLHELTYVMCYATVGSDQLDLGTLLVSSGFAFAALDRDGLPYSASYAVAEQTAREGKRGLWQFSDVQHPAIALAMEANKTTEDAPNDR